jgi:hypothetical protein
MTQLMASCGLVLAGLAPCAAASGASPVAQLGQAGDTLRPLRNAGWSHGI